MWAKARVGDASPAPARVVLLAALEGSHAERKPRRRRTGRPRAGGRASHRPPRTRWRRRRSRLGKTESVESGLVPRTQQRQRRLKDLGLERQQGSGLPSRHRTTMGGYLPIVQWPQGRRLRHPLRSTIRRDGWRARAGLASHLRWQFGPRTAWGPHALGRRPEWTRRGVMWAGPVARCGR